MTGVLAWEATPRTVCVIRVSRVSLYATHATTGATALCPVCVQARRFEPAVQAMVGDENVSAQRAEGGSGSTGGIKKKKPRRRAKGAASHIQRQVAARHEHRSEHARQLSPALPPRGV